MLEFVKFVIEQFAEKKDKIKYIVDDADSLNITITVVLDKDDMGKVIGRQGRIAKSIRTLLRAISIKQNVKCNLIINEEE